MNRAKDAALRDGESALESLPSAGRVSYEGGDGADDEEWHNTFRAWPTEEVTKDELLDDIEDHDARDYVLIPSRADGQAYCYVTVHTQTDA